MQATMKTLVQADMTIDPPASAVPGRLAEGALEMNITVIAARKLVHPVSRFWRKYYVSLCVGANQTTETKSTRKAFGSNPQWNQTLSFCTTIAAPIQLMIFAKRLRKRPMLMATLGDIASLPDGLHILPLKSDGSNLRDSASVEIDIRRSSAIADDETNSRGRPTSADSQGPVATHDIGANPVILTSSEVTEGDDRNPHDRPATLIAELQQAKTELVATNDAVSTVSVPPGTSTIVNQIDEVSAVALAGQSTAVDFTPLLEKMKGFCNAMDAITKVHPYAKMAWDIFSAVYKVVQAQLDRDEKVRELLATMDGLFADVQEYIQETQLDAQAEDLLSEIARQTVECCLFIREYSRPGFVARLAKNLLSVASERITKYCERFKQLRKAFRDRKILETRIIVTRVMAEAQKINEKSDLKDLAYARGASLCPRISKAGDRTLVYEPPSKVCLPGTRVSILNEIESWVMSDEENTARVFLLTGPAGTGKSSIAHTIAYRFALLDRLGASFAFDRNEQERKPSTLFPTLSVDLADFDHDFRSALGSEISGVTDLRGTNRIDLQFSRFIVAPLKKLEMIGPILIVIDALDECVDQESLQFLLSALKQGLAQLPESMRILITSRPSKEIVDALDGDPCVLRKALQIASYGEVELYIAARLSTMRSDQRERLGERACKTLALRSQGVFQWAVVACSLITNPPSGSTFLLQYKAVVESGTSQTKDTLLDMLYEQILSGQFVGDDAQERFRIVVGLILCTSVPLSGGVIRELFPSKSDDFDAVLPYLAAVFSGVNGPSTSPIRPLHTSFRDYLLQQKIGRPLFIDYLASNRALASACLTVLLSRLHFNMSQAQSSCRTWTFFPMNTWKSEYDAPRAPALEYACRYWLDHLLACSSGPDWSTDLLPMADRFLTTNFLFWVEELCQCDRLYGTLIFVGSKLSQLALLLHKGAALNVFDSRLKRLVVDARDFIMLVTEMRTPKTLLLLLGPRIRPTVGSMEVKQTHKRFIGAHIYLSVLPFTPEISSIKAIYGGRFRRTLSLHTGSSKVCLRTSSPLDAQPTPTEDFSAPTETSPAEQSYTQETVCPHKIKETGSFRDIEGRYEDMMRDRYSELRPELLWIDNSSSLDKDAGWVRLASSLGLPNGDGEHKDRCGPKRNRKLDPYLFYAFRGLPPDLDLSNFVYGKEWTRCYTPDELVD